MSAGYVFSVPLAYGGAAYKESSTKVIRFIRHGCVNRPFFHISVQEITEEPYGAVIEQIGVYDPLPNKNNEKLVCLNFNRVQHWLDAGAMMSIAVKRLLGLSGYLPVHPSTYQAAWNRRKLLQKTIEELEAMKNDRAKSSVETESGTSSA